MRIFNLVAPALLALPLSLPMAGAPALADEVPATITVTGEGMVGAAPDLATVSLGVVQDAETAEAAMSAASAAVSAVLDKLKAAGIAEADIQTSGLMLGPRYDYGSDGNTPPKLIGYSATNMVTAKVRDLDKLGTVLDGVVTGGANSVNGLDFGLNDDQAAMDEARRRAVADAARKAALLAGEAGVTVGRVLSISEAGNAMPMAMAMGAASFERKADMVPVAAGTLNLTANVTVVYEISGK